MPLRKASAIPVVAVIVALAVAFDVPSLFSGARKADMRDPGKDPLGMNTSSEGDTSPRSKSDAEWQQILTPDQFAVTRRKGTEPAFSGEYWDCKTPGMYGCVCCGADLFDSTTKFESGTGWPSFYEPVDVRAIAEESEGSFFFRRTEVLCRRCGAHLGHVFADAPSTPTGLRYCLNSAALKFVEDSEAKSDEQ